MAHIASTSQDNNYSPASGMISGMIATSLAQSHAKASEKLHHCIKAVLVGDCTKVPTIPPADNCPHRQRFAKLLMFFEEKPRAINQLISMVVPLD